MAASFGGADRALAFSNPLAYGIVGFKNRLQGRTPREDEILKPLPSGLYIYKSSSDSLVPVDESDFPANSHVKTAIFMNDIFAKAYFGGKVWEGELTAKPQDGTGFFKYITPKGRVVFFPMCWTFDSCPEAFFLAAPLSEDELGEEVSYYNVYTSIAEMANTGKCKSYFRVYETGEGDRTQTAQMIVYSDSRVTLTPEMLSDAIEEGVTTSVSTVSSISAVPNTNSLKNNTPEYVETIELKSGQIIARDASKWATVTRTDPTARKGKLPPVFVN